jgi:hypothetical protein
VTRRSASPSEQRVALCARMRSPMHAGPMRACMPHKRPLTIHPCTGSSSATCWTTTSRTNCRRTRSRCIATTTRQTTAARCPSVRAHAFDGRTAWCITRARERLHPAHYRQRRNQLRGFWSEGGGTRAQPPSLPHLPTFAPRLQTSGTPPARSASTACTRRTTTAPTRASWCST